MDRVKMADDFHNQKLNCCQAVVLAFQDVIGVDESLILRMTEGLGFGACDTYGTCGAVAAMDIVVAMHTASGDPQSITKKETYRQARELNTQFREKNGSTVCRDIKGIDSGEMLRSCPGCIEDAVVILEKWLANREG